MDSQSSVLGFTPQSVTKCLMTSPKPTGLVGICSLPANVPLWKLPLKCTCAAIRHGAGAVDRLQLRSSKIAQPPLCTPLDPRYAGQRMTSLKTSAGDPDPLMADAVRDPLVPLEAVLAARRRPMSERLELALSWNAVAAELRSGLLAATGHTIPGQ